MNLAASQARLAEAQRLMMAGELAAASAMLSAIVAEAPDDVNALHLLAGVKRQAGDREGALALLNRAVRLAPSAAPVQFNRANLLFELQRYEEAVASYDAALAQRPQHAESHLN